MEILIFLSNQISDKSAFIALDQNILDLEAKVGPANKGKVFSLTEFRNAHWILKIEKKLLSIRSVHLSNGHCYIG